MGLGGAGVKNFSLETCDGAPSTAHSSIFYNYQSGCRSSFPTDTCRVHLLDHIKNKNAKSLYTGLVLLDLQRLLTLLITIFYAIN